MNLTATLAQVPDNVLMTTKGNLDLNGLLAHLILSAGPKTAEDAVQALNGLGKVTSLYRIANFEAAKRRKLAKEIPPPVVETVSVPTPSIEETYVVVQKAAERAIRKYSPLQRTMEASDLANGYMAHYLEKGYDKKFDPSKGTPLSAWVGRGLRNWCIDLLRSRDFQFQQEKDGESVFRTISGDQTLTEEGASLLSMISTEDDPLSTMVVEEAMSAMDDRTRSIVQSRMTGYTQAEIGEREGISRSRVAQLITKAQVVVRKVLS